MDLKIVHDLKKIMNLEKKNVILKKVQNLEKKNIHGVEKVREPNKRMPQTTSLGSNS